MSLWETIKDTARDNNRDNFDISINTEVKKGSVLRVRSSKFGVTFDHFGIYAGKRNVIHFADGVVKKESLACFTDCAIGNNSGLLYTKLKAMCGHDGLLGEPIIEVCAYSVSNVAEVYTSSLSLKRAKSKIGMKDYDFLTNNCEHFANWCRLGIPYSSQASCEASPSELKWDSPIIKTREDNGGIDILSIARTRSNTSNKLGMAVSRRIFYSELY